MSITTAVAFGGYDKKFTNTTGGLCGVTAESPYFRSESATPFTTHGVRPTMILAGTSAANAMAVIDQGVAADGTFPPGQGFFVRTTDATRSNPRYADFQQTVAQWNTPGPLQMTYIDNANGKGSNWVSNQQNILFYETGFANVSNIMTNTYRPGAIADHLTSSGGLFGNGGQMSVLRWLEAGVTGSYGTMAEPCAFTQKFPVASIVVDHYFRGDTLLEAYWKSVEWPGEGVFVGEPLARPFGTTSTFSGGTLTITTTIFRVGKTYTVSSGPTATGPWAPVKTGLSVPAEQIETIVISGANAPYYQLVMD